MKPLVDALRQRWRTLAPRERRAVAAAALVLGLALLWLALLRPALRTVRQAPGDIETLQRQLREVRRQADELTLLKSAPEAPADDIDLHATVEAWMHEHAPDAQASVGVLPDGASLEVHAMHASTLLELAREARRDWGATLAVVQLTRGADGFAGSVQLTRARPR
jgi:general secretion pathway protein M